MSTHRVAYWAMEAEARRAASGRRLPPRPMPPTTRSTVGRGGRVGSLGGRRGRARVASATRPLESGSAPSPSPGPRCRCASDQRRPSGIRHRRAASRARDGRRRPRPPPRRHYRAVIGDRRSIRAPRQPAVTSERPGVARNVSSASRTWAANPAESSRSTRRRSATDPWSTNRSPGIPTIRTGTSR
jgi:hypothetical protein